MTGTVKRRLIHGFAIAVASAASAVLVPAAAYGAAATRPLAMNTAVGTLPLLAALGIGIVVAVGAVIAFLQMTAKGKEPKRYAAEGNDPDDEHEHDFVRNEEPEERRDEEWAVAEHGREDREWAEYTIPLRAVASDRESAESAAEAEDGPTLCGVEGELAGSSFRMNGSGLSIGRDPALCQVVFPLHVGEVSRKHCTLQFEKETQTFTLEDHGSSNGTFLSRGDRLEPGKRYPLRSGERFALSGNTHWFEVRN